MKTILVPTDFSGPADAALNYARTLAKKLNSKIILLHAFQVLAPMAEVPFAIWNDERQSLKADSDGKLKRLAFKIESSGAIPYACLSEEGDAVDSILKVAKEEKADLIIMGATGETGLTGVIFGSVSLKVMEKAQCPVVAVPRDFVVGESIKRITFATDYHRSDLAAIGIASEIAATTGAQLNILHICDAVIGADEEKTLMKNFMERVKSKTVYPNLSFEIIHSYNVEERLKQYIEDRSTDMLMMATHYRTFFDRLFGKSITKEMTRSTPIPVVAFHYNAKTEEKFY